MQADFLSTEKALLEALSHSQQWDIVPDDPESTTIESARSLSPDIYDTNDTGGHDDDEDEQHVEWYNAADRSFHKLALPHNDNDDPDDDEANKNNRDEYHSEWDDFRPSKRLKLTCAGDSGRRQQVCKRCKQGGFSCKKEVQGVHECLRCRIDDETCLWSDCA
jgi:hypothetical protein